MTSAEPPAPAGTSRQLVVGAAMLRGNRLLACRRTAPAAVAGRWELPGGKVEAGESPDAAVVRELAEELGLRVRVTGWLDGVTPIGETHELRVATVVLEAGAPTTPRPTEHDRVRWLRHDELDDVDWLEPDRPFLPKLRSLLAVPR